MSRCFPYPPPGYSNNDALIESIKLQREREKAKAERKKEKKEKKREKKERRERKEKEKLNSNTTVSHDEPAKKLGKSWGYLEAGHKSKSRIDSTEQLERSGLTEEHGQPIRSHNPSNSSDSTQNSNKRKRHSSPINGTSNGCQTNGNTFRIRLPLQKHKEPVASASKEELCSTSGRTDLHVQQKYEVAQETTRQRDICFPPLVRDIVVTGLTARPDNALNNTIIRKAEIFVPDQRPSASGSTSSSYKKLKKASKIYTELMTNWVPPTLERVLPDSGDQEWLFGGKRQKREGEQRKEGSDDVSCCCSSALQPRARYLPEADIYALPYTIPF
ncbi:hypothetical protein LguiB_020199 [Lonicera macranthoides]